MPIYYRSWGTSYSKENSKLITSKLNWFILNVLCTVVHSVKKSSRRCGAVEKPERRNYYENYAGALECILILTSST